MKLTPLLLLPGAPLLPALEGGLKRREVVSCSDWGRWVPGLRAREEGERARRGWGLGFGAADCSFLDQLGVTCRL